MRENFRGFALAVTLAVGSVVGATSSVEAQQVAVTPAQIETVRTACASGGGGCVAAVQTLTRALSTVPGVTMAAALNAVTASLSVAANAAPATQVATRASYSNALSAVASVATAEQQPAIAQVASLAAATVTAGETINTAAVAQAQANVQTTPAQTQTQTQTNSVGGSASAQ